MRKSRRNATRYLEAVRTLAKGGLGSDVGAERFALLKDGGFFDRDTGVLSKAGSRRLLELSGVGAVHPADSFWVLTGIAADPVLVELCERYGTDKGSSLHWRDAPGRSAHTYVDVYSSLFMGRRDEVRSLLEVGIFRGASLRTWRDYFPNAEIYGADIDSALLFEEERITTTAMDQTDPVSIAHAIASLGISSVDAIIDDGLHEFDANRVLFESTFELLSERGTYVIEDCTPDTLRRFRAYFDDANIAALYYSGFRPDGHKLADNSLIVISARQSGDRSRRNPVRSE